MRARLTPFDGLEPDAWKYDELRCKYLVRVVLVVAGLLKDDFLVVVSRQATYTLPITKRFLDIGHSLRFVYAILRSHHVDFDVIERIFRL